MRLGAVADATGRNDDCEFAARGTTITFPGYRQVYVESTTTRPTTTAEREALLPPLTVGQTVPGRRRSTPNGHTTSPPARYTEASLVKRLEELGIGRPVHVGVASSRPSRTAATCGRRARRSCPTWTAFAVVGLLEKHFDELVDYAFTARIEDDLDAIARNERAQGRRGCSDFYFGDEDDRLPGLKRSWRRTSTRSTPPRSTRSRSAPTPTATRSS